MRAGRGRAMSWTLSGVGVVLAVVLVSLLSVVLMITVAGMVFSGSLAPFLRQGIGLALWGGIALGVVGALGASFRGSVCIPQDVTGVILALAAAAIAAQVAEPGVAYATVAVMIGVASVATGLAFLAAGTLRLGVLVRFIPFPVMGGFLASSGFLMAAGAVRMVTGGMELAELLRPEAVWRWAPVLALGVALVVVARRSRHAVALPLMVGLAFLGFYAWLLVSGTSLAEASARGLLLGPFAEKEGFLGAFRPGFLFQADYGALVSALPALATVVGLAFVGAMLNASGVELGTGRPVDLNRDLRAVGAGNLVAGLCGGITGYHSLGSTLLANRLVGFDTRWIGLGVGLTSGAVLVAGASILGMLPVSVFAAVLAFLGIDVLYRWLWIERRRLPLSDFLLILAMLVVSVVVGFLQAIALGVLAASALFVLSYSRLDVIRGRLSGALRFSTIERSEASTRLIAAHGDRTMILELQGYVFFGTAHVLLGDIEAAISRAERPIRTVILDFRRVQGLDASAVFNLGKLAQLCDRNGVSLVLTDLRPSLRRQMESAGVISDGTVLPTLDDALAQVEGEALEGQDPAALAGSAFDALLARASAADAVFDRETVPAGTRVLGQGDPSDCLVLLESGRLSASVDGPGGEGRMKVATFLPGAVVGEIGLYAGTPRTATVIADVESVIRKVTRTGLEQLSVTDPALARDFHALIAGLLARRLTRTTALLREVSR
jgi:sulfate permease, SulP family